MNRLGVKDIVAYMLVGLALWLFVLKSGVHATLAGVVLAFAIPPMVASPRRPTPSRRRSTPGCRFSSCRSSPSPTPGVKLAGLQLADLGQPVTLGVILGLLVGKQIGIFVFSWLAVASGRVKRPEGASWLQIYGVATLCGVGFTMSLFVGSLAFEHLPQPELLTANRLGILVGSGLAGPARLPHPALCPTQPVSSLDPTQNWRFRSLSGVRVPEDSAECV